MEGNKNVFDIQGFKNMTKDLLTNKFVIGGAVVGFVVEGLRYVRAMDIGKILIDNSIQSIFNITLVGIPIGSTLGKFLGITITGTIIAEVIKVAFEIKSQPEKTASILIREGIAFSLLIIGIACIGKLGMDLIKTVQNYNFSL